MAGRSACFWVAGVLALALAGCGDDDDGAGWRTEVDKTTLSGAVLSVWGSGPKDVYAVGGPLGNDGFETLAMHWDGKAWTALAPGGNETLWWVSGSGPGDVWMVGERGRILRWNGTSFTATPSGTTATLWGVVAFSPSDAWAVGGMPGSEGPDDVVLHWNGTSWTSELLPPKGLALFKVWGTADGTLIIVGEAGVIWRRLGPGAWVEQSAVTPPLARDRLFTVDGCSSSDVWAVGSTDVLHWDGNSWSRQQVTLPNIVNGVSCRDGQVTLVGFGGLKLRKDGATWLDESNLPPFNDLHGAWDDGAGSVWVVGGDFLSPARPGVKRAGVIARYRR